tara:strand:+ start:2393 stop:2614 length:222 start_codon:yes stop_codon:yes gene_type:complete
MIVDDELSELFCKETGKVVDNTNQPYIDDYIKWLESKVNNVVLDDVIKCDSLWHNKHVHRFGSCSVCSGKKKN